MTGRGLRGRRIARAIVLAVAGLIILVVIVLATIPNSTMGPSISPFDFPLTWAGLAGMGGGLLWLIQIARTASDSDRRRSSGWRATRES